MHVDIADVAGLHDVAAAQQLQQAHVHLQPADRGERGSVRPGSRTNPDVAQIHRCIQRVEAELISAELNLLACEEGDDLSGDEATCGRRMDRDQGNDDKDTEGEADDAKSEQCPAWSRPRSGRFG